MAKNEETLMQMVGGVFQGPLKGWSIYALIFGLAVTGFFIYALLQFLAAETVVQHLHWEVALILSGFGIVLMKIWFWLLMMRNSIVRAL
jgi:hypothetical protein